ncbi:GntR family transcriptional regulator [Mesobacillus foraminis]|uniref:GntR family transcriptional regulator of arabinose operon n=1 Tax=Mesobacillus foraminis TaxID=279826 RepID=A0A4R2BEU8_9BACI|nr:GntR family transcriptional regulator [Mesobacillus foraminis]TCN24965.1 GntR family transcriptional regulator of arabinose operon [Mesobacillus foraminis]
MATKLDKVKQEIKSRILDGTFQPNQKISSESELMKQFAVSRHTVRAAIGELVNKGWLYREQGAGTFCADRSMDSRLMSGSNQKNIAIITTFISEYIFPSIIRGAESYLSKHGYNVSLFSTNNDHSEEKRILEKILTEQFDGVIVEPTKSALSNPNISYYLNLERQQIPYIMINAYYDELEPVSITMNDEKGGYVQTEHLIQLGHTNIVGFFKTDDLQGVKRMKGFIKAHRKFGVPINPNGIVTYDSSGKAAKPVEALARLLSVEQSARPTAIVGYNDELAILMLDVFREKSISVPEDLSLVGFDDSYMGRLTEVKLTTIQHPQSKMGETAAKMIVDMIKEKNSQQRKSPEKVESVVFEPNLILRSSTASLQLKKHVTL